MAMPENTLSDRPYPLSPSLTACLPLEQLTGARSPDRNDEVESGLERGQFEAWFQPQLRLVDGAVVAVEALARWKHPVRGLLGPEHFLASVAESGLANALTRQMVSRCFRCLDSMRDNGQVNVSTAFNVSWDWIVDRDNIDDLVVRTRNAGHDPSKIIIEITEGIQLIRNTRALRNLRILKAHGYVLALDDFGSGYNAIEHLRYMPIDHIKIDRSLVEKSSSDTRSTRILQGLIGMLHSIGHTVTVEGVSCEADLDLVTYLQADLAQGNLLAKPMSAEALVPWLSGIRHDNRSDKGGDRA